MSKIMIAKSEAVKLSDGTVMMGVSWCRSKADRKIEGGPGSGSLLMKFRASDIVSLQNLCKDPVKKSEIFKARVPQLAEKLGLSEIWQGKKAFTNESWLKYIGKKLRKAEKAKAVPASALSESMLLPSCKYASALAEAEKVYSSVELDFDKICKAASEPSAGPSEWPETWMEVFPPFQAKPSKPAEAQAPQGSLDA